MQACRGIPDQALEAGGLQLALRVARAALGLAPSLEQIDLDLLRSTVEPVPEQREDFDE
jgi:hypothetical protein